MFELDLNSLLSQVRNAVFGFLPVVKANMLDRCFLAGFERIQYSKSLYKQAQASTVNESIRFLCWFENFKVTSAIEGSST